MRIHAGFHSFMEISQMFYNKCILLELIICYSFSKNAEKTGQHLFSLQGDSKYPQMHGTLEFISTKFSSLEHAAGCPPGSVKYSKISQLGSLSDDRVSLVPGVSSGEREREKKTL